MIQALQISVAHLLAQCAVPPSNSDRRFRRVSLIQAGKLGEPRLNFAVSVYYTTTESIAPVLSERYVFEAES